MVTDRASGAVNVMAHQTRLTPDGKGYRLNGLKIFSSQGTAKNYLVMARTSREGREGYGCAIVEKEIPGFVVGKYEDKLGWRGTNTGTVMFTDVYVPPENILGDLLTANHDLGVVNQTSFLGHAVTSLGCLEGMFERTLEYVKGRTLYDAPMSHLQPISYWLADIYTKIEACRSLLYSATRVLPAQGEHSWEVVGIDGLLGSLCKAYIGEIDHEDRVPDDLVARCKELNFFALFVSPQYGGLGADIVTTCLVLQEIAKETPHLRVCSMSKSFFVLTPSRFWVPRHRSRSTWCHRPKANGRWHGHRPSPPAQATSWRTTPG